MKKKKGGTMRVQKRLSKKTVEELKADAWTEIRMLVGLILLGTAGLAIFFHYLFQ